MDKKINWVTFCKRTCDPKLAYIERLLTEAGISHKRDGQSMHGHIVLVPAEQEPEAWAILDRKARKDLGLPVRHGLTLDDIPDDHRAFHLDGFNPTRYEDCEAWWTDKPTDWIRPCVVFEVRGHIPDLTVALGILPTLEEAERVGREWMQEYGFDVVETYKGCGECAECLDAYEDPNDYAGMGWVRHDGRP